MYLSIIKKLAKVNLKGVLADLLMKELFKETRFFIEKEFELLPKNMLRKKELSVLIERTGGEVIYKFRKRV